jgi:hypothetical protein
LDGLYAIICTYKKLMLALFLNDNPSKETFLLVTNGAHSFRGRGGNQDVAQLLSFVLSNPMLEQVFSIMNCYWRNEHNWSSINLINGKTAIKMNYNYTCKDVCTFVLKDKKSQRSKSPRSIFLNSNRKPNCQTVNYKF